MPTEDRVATAQSADNSADFPAGHFRMVSGSASDDFGNILAHQVCEALWYSADATSELKIRQVCAALAALRGIAPRDEIEGMLGAQMVAAHAAAMECYRRSMIRGQAFETRQAALKQAANMSRLYAEQVQALAKYRGKGQQFVRVERVNVTADQAIVGGTINHAGHGGRANSAKSEEQPHVLGHAQSDALPSQIAPNRPAVSGASRQGLERMPDARRGRRRS